MSFQQKGKPTMSLRTYGTAPTWWLVFKRELSELWMGGKAPILLLVYCLLLGVITYVMASNSELSLIPPQEMVYELLKTAIAVGLFICLVVGSDSLSGERERSTLESLLLTPTSRRQIVVGKFLAAMSPWPLALAITIPYMKVLSQGNEIFGQAVPWGAFVGTLLAPGFVGLGMFVSYWSNTNRTSFFISLGIYIVFLIPTQLPGHAQSGPMGQMLQQSNPVAAAYHFLSKTLVNNRTVLEFWTWLLSSAIFSLLILTLLFWFGGNLRLEGGRSTRLTKYLGRLVGLSVVLLFVAFSVGSPALAAPKEADNVLEHPVSIDIDMDYQTVKAGDHILYNTVVTNHAKTVSPPLCIAMNIINLNAAGDIVDPEDWSPQRTQYIESLEPGQASTFGWRVNAILDGDYLIYMVVIPEPAGEAATSQPVASSGIHLTVTEYTKLNPAGVLPYVIGGPVVLIIAIILLYRARRRNIDVGKAA